MQVPRREVALELESRHLAAVKNILCQHLRDGQRVYAFGSRVKGSAKAFSDLDLCIAGDELNFAQLASLRDGFSESDIPYFVDVVNSGFLALIEADFLQVEY